jgi:hypothetical protein
MFSNDVSKETKEVLQHGSGFRVTPTNVIIYESNFN